MTFASARAALLGWGRPGPNRATIYLGVLLCWVIWTYAIPALRPPLLRGLPLPYPILVLLAVAVAVQRLRGPFPLPRVDAVPLVIGPTMISVGILVGYLLHPGESSLDVAWRLAMFPWVIPVLVFGLDHGGTVLAWKGVTAGFLVLLAYGTYGFFTGHIGDPAEHTLLYFGFHYTPSTRNADAMYFLVLFFHLLLPTVVSGTWSAFLWTVLSGLTGAALVLTQSRGIWLAGLAGILTAIATARQARRWDGRTKVRLLAALVIAVVAVAAVYGWRGAGTGGTEKLGILLIRRGANLMAGDPGGSLHDRIRLATVALRLLAHYPITGIGPGTVRKRIEQTGIHLDQVAANHVENAFLQVWLDAGLLGLIGFVLLWLWVLFRPLGAALSDIGEARYWCIKGLAAALTVYMLVNVIFDNLAFWTVVGLSAAYQVHLLEPRG